MKCLEMSMKSCILLCGGRGTRMGRDKGSIILNGEPMITHVLKTLENITDEIIVVLGNKKQLMDYQDILSDKINFNKYLRIYTDKIEDQGPMMGILTGFLNVSSDYALVLPCDSPFVEKSFVLKMFELAEENEFDAIVPVWDDGRIEPLHSVYKKNIVKVIESLLDEGIRDVRSLIGSIDVKYMNVKMLDKTTRSFKNINTLEDIPSIK